MSQVKQLLVEKKLFTKGELQSSFYGLYSPSVAVWPAALTPLQEPSMRHHSFAVIPQRVLNTLLPQLCGSFLQAHDVVFAQSPSALRLYRHVVAEGEQHSPKMTSQHSHRKKKY